MDATGNRYVRIPLVVLFTLAPILGGLYVVLLPFIGLAIMLAFLVRAMFSPSHS